MLIFENPKILFLLLLVPLVWVVRFFYQQYRRRVWNKFSTTELFRSLAPDISIFRERIKFVLIAFALAFLILGIANPQMGKKLELGKSKGVDIVIALDISNSMLAEDIRPNRLERSKNAILNLINKLKNDRIGLVLFAGRAYTQLPITTDYGAAKMLIRGVNSSLIETQGTALGGAIEQSIQALETSKSKNKVIVIITDGENHEDDAVEIAMEAANLGIIIHTIGIGSPEGTPIPISGKGNSQTYMKDRDGSVVITRLNDIGLKEIAANGGGKFFLANESNAGLQKMVKEISKLEETEFESKVFSDYEDYFQWFLIPALLLLIIEILIGTRKSILLANKKI